MDVYIYQAALLCACCGERTRKEIEQETGSSQQMLETGVGSEGYPDGPYPDGGGEADSPQHCDQCGVFLENPLTGDGYAYLREQAAEFLDEDEDGPDIEAMAEAAQADWDAKVADLPEGHPARRDPVAPLAQWLRFYPEAYERGNGYVSERDERNAIVSVEMTITLRDGTVSKASINQDAEWQQWGATESRLFETVAALDAMAQALDQIDALDTTD